MGKTRDLFKKIKDTKIILHTKMGTIKDRNSMDLTQVEVGNRFKELGLTDGVPIELWTEVCDIVQETGIKTMP